MKKLDIKLVFISFLLLVTNVIYAQKKGSIEEVDKLAKKMFVDMNNRDYEAILEMTHPKVFEIASKEQMMHILKSTLEGNNQFKIEIPKITPEYKLSELFIEKENNLNYAFTSYDLRMKMTFLNQEFDEDSKKVMKSMMKLKGMEATFVSANTIDVLMKDRITILLKDDSTKNKWVMVNYEPNSPLYANMLPTTLMESAKEYQANLLLERKKSTKN